MEKGLMWVGIALAIMTIVSFVGNAVSQEFKEIGCVMNGDKICVIENPNK
jgi:Flp pilus assembly pilin Flp